MVSQNSIIIGPDGSVGAKTEAQNLVATDTLYPPRRLFGIGNAITYAAGTIAPTVVGAFGVAPDSGLFFWGGFVAIGWGTVRGIRRRAASLNFDVDKAKSVIKFAEEYENVAKSLKRNKKNSRKQTNSIHIETTDQLTEMAFDTISFKRVVSYEYGWFAAGQKNMRRPNELRSFGAGLWNGIKENGTARLLRRSVFGVERLAIHGISLVHYGLVDTVKDAFNRYRRQKNSEDGLTYSQHVANWRKACDHQLSRIGIARQALAFRPSRAVDQIAQRIEKRIDFSLG